jgi:hypothetical protein
MAKRVLNRRELRKANEQAAEKEKTTPAAEQAPATKKSAKSAAAKPKRARKKKEPPRMCARWGVFDAAMKQVAIFDYNQRADADRKVAELASKKNARFFLQIVKEPMPEPAAGDEEAAAK